MAANPITPEEAIQKLRRNDRRVPLQWFERDAIADLIERMQAREQKLREALEKHAAESNWTDDGGTYGGKIVFLERENGYELAQRVLKEVDGE